MREKNDQVFQLSLSEIFIIICFILLLLLGYQIFTLSHKNKELANKMAEVTQLDDKEKAIVAATNELKANLLALGVKDPQDILIKLVDASKAREETERLKVLLNEKDEKITALASVEKALEQLKGKKDGKAANQLILQTLMSYEQLKKLVIENADETNPDPAEVVKRIGELKEMENKLKNALNDDNVLESKDIDRVVANAQAFEMAQKDAMNPVVLEKANKDLRGQIQYLQNRLNSGRGVDLPPCWVNEQTGKIEMLFTLELRENTVSLAPAWPAARQEDAMALPGINDLLARSTRPYNDFLQAVKGISDVSKAKECRFYVRLASLIPDAVTSDRRRLMIETVFYKSEVRR